MSCFSKAEKANDGLGWNVALCVVIAWLNGGLGVVLPNLMPFWKAHGITIDQVWVLQGLFALTVALCTVPFGLLADAKGRKSCMLSGLVLHLAGELAYLFGDSFLAFLIAEVFMGVGVALVSGADSSLLFDTLKVRGEEESHPKWAGLAQGGLFCLSAAVSLLAGVIGAVDERLPFAVSSSFVALQLVLVLFVKEPKVDSEERLVSVAQIPQVLAFCFQPGSQQLWLIGAWSLCTVGAWLAVWFYPLCFEQAGLTVGQQGAVFCFYNTVAALASFGARRLKEKSSIPMAMLLFVGCSALGHLLLGTLVVAWAFVFGALHQVVRGAGPVIFGHALHKQTGSEIRATVLSVQGAFATLLYGGINLRLGACIETFGFQAVLVTLALLLLAAAFGLRALHPGSEETASDD